MNSNSLLGIVLSLIVTGIIGTFLYNWVKKEKKPLGELITNSTIKNNETILIALSIITYCAEALTAATVVIAGHVMPNIWARMLLHLGISFGGFVCEVTVLRDLASVFEKGLDPGSRTVRIIVMTLVSYFAVAVPLWNVGLIAANMGQLETYDIYIYSFTQSILPWGKDAAEMAAYYETIGYPANYNPRGNLEPVLYASLLATIITIGYAFIAGLRSISSPERRSILFGVSQEKKEDKNSKKEEEKEDKEDKDIVTSNLSILLEWMGYEGKDLEKQAGLAKTSLFKITEIKDQSEMTIRLAELVNRVKRFNLGEFGTSTKEKSEKELEKEIRAFFETAPKGKSNKNIADCGLGLVLKKK